MRYAEYIPGKLAPELPPEPTPDLLAEGCSWYLHGEPRGLWVLEQRNGAGETQPGTRAAGPFENIIGASDWASDFIAYERYTWHPIIEGQEYVAVGCREGGGER